MQQTNKGSPAVSFPSLLCDRERHSSALTEDYPKSARCPGTSRRSPATLSVFRPERNHLLGALQEDTMARLRPHLKFVHLPLGQVLYESGARMHRVYFPVDSIISLLYVMCDGTSAGVSVTGNEGVLGVPAVMGADTTTGRVVVKSAGGAHHLPTRILKEEFDRHSDLMRTLVRYTQALSIQTAQTAVCNRHHMIEQQLCRWLLMSLDRVQGHRLLMTQESIANMLGVRREGVTEAAGKLQKLGVISYRRGEIEVLDREQLESLSCECYAVVKKESDRLLG